MSLPSNVALVTFESTARTTASGNHIEAVRQALEAAHVEVVVCGGDRPSKARRWATAWCSHMRQLASTDVSYVRNHPVAIIAVVAARVARHTVILEVNGPPEDIAGSRPRLAFLTQPLRWITALAVKMSDGVVVPTPGLRRYVAAWGRSRPTAVIPAGFDESLFRPGAGIVSNNAAHSRPQAVFVGANSSWQGVDVMIEALDDPSWPGDTDLVLIGAFEGLDSHPRLRTPGRLEPSEVAAHLAGALVALSPKTYRGSTSMQTGQAPLKVFEALGCGTPCIVTDVPTQNEIIESTGAGTVIAPNDPAALADAVAKYRNDPVRRAAHAAAASTAAAQFSWSALAVDTVEFISSVHS